MSDIMVNGTLLQRAAIRSSYAVPQDGLIFFGIRGALPVASQDLSFSAERSVQFAPVDFKRMRCTLGQWRINKNEVALFVGSTAPYISNIERARKLGGNGTNLLMLGRHEYEIGDHKAGKPNGHRAFRQSMFQPVWRTADDLNYDLRDKLDLGSGPNDFVWDNIHSAYSDDKERGYSSAGCQVICGLPRSPARKLAEETGPWRVFIENAYDSGQRNFVYMLFSSEELALVSSASDSELKQVVRYGSSGPFAKAVQEALRERKYLSDDADGEFGRNSLIALIKFQAEILGPGKCDGVCGPETAAALSLEPPPISKVGAPPAPTRLKSKPGNARPELLDDSDFEPDVLEALERILSKRLSKSEPKQDIGVVSKTNSSASDIAQANFERCQEIVKVFEGGFVNDRRDPGGATNYGITIKTLSAHRGRSVSPGEVANMSYEEAKKIYFENYWSKTSCGSMPGPLALAVYNAAVHAGPRAAATFLQRALNKNGVVVKVDGGIGGETLDAIRKVSISELTDDFLDLYEEKLRAHREFKHFGKGFMRRVGRMRIETERWLSELGTLQAELPTPKLPNEEEDAVTSQDPEVVTLLEVLKQVRHSRSSNGLTDESTSSTADKTPGSDIRSLLRDIVRYLDRDKPVILPPDSAATNVVTPVNGALGQGLGRLLDGRKSGLGIIGSLASALLMPTRTINGAGDVVEIMSPLVQLLPKVLGPIASATPATMPIFLALTAWGLLGKIDKYARAKNVSPTLSASELIVKT